MLNSDFGISWMGRILIVDFRKVHAFPHWLMAWNSRIASPRFKVKVRKPGKIFGHDRGDIVVSDQILAFEEQISRDETLISIFVIVNEVGILACREEILENSCFRGENHDSSIDRASGSFLIFSSWNIALDSAEKVTICDGIIGISDGDDIAVEEQNFCEFGHVPEMQFCHDGGTSKAFFGSVFPWILNGSHLPNCPAHTFQFFFGLSRDVVENETDHCERGIDPQQALSKNEGTHSIFLICSKRDDS